MLQVFLLLFCRAVVGLAFAASAVGKLLNLPSFQQTLVEFGVPRRLGRPAAWSILLAELNVCLLMLADGPLLKAGFVLAAALLLAFSAALGTALARRLSISCNCFGPGGPVVSPYHLWRNCGFVCCAGGGWMACAGGVAASVPWPILAVALLGGIVFVALFTQLDAIAELLRGG